MTLGSFTRLGSLFFDWEPLVDRPVESKYLWLALYASSQAKRWVPGLWKGAISSMAEAARMRLDTTVEALDDLIVHELVEFDRQKRVARLTEFPDAGEWPQSPFILKAWWKRFHDVPECQVRDAHVGTLRRQLERGAREAEKNVGGKVSDAHEEIWGQTFGLIKIPSPRRRGVRRLADDDTSTPTQPSLFQKLPDPESDSSEIPEPSYPQDVVDKYDLVPFLPDQRNQVSESDSGMTRANMEREKEKEREKEFFLSYPEGESLRGGRPTLTLVPPPAKAPFTVDQLLGLLDTRGLVVTQEARFALGRAITEIGDIPQGEDTIALLRAWRRLTVGEMMIPGSLVGEVQRARERAREAFEKSEMLRAAREGAGI